MDKINAYEFTFRGMSLFTKRELTLFKSSYCLFTTATKVDKGFSPPQLNRRGGGG